MWLSPLDQLLGVWKTRLVQWHPGEAAGGSCRKETRGLKAPYTRLPTHPGSHNFVLLLYHSFPSRPPAIRHQNFSHKSQQLSRNTAAVIFMKQHNNGMNLPGPGWQLVAVTNLAHPSTRLHANNEHYLPFDSSAFRALSPGYIRAGSSFVTIHKHGRWETHHCWPPNKSSLRTFGAVHFSVPFCYCF